MILRKLGNECEEASKILNIENLRDAKFTMLDELGGKLLKRARHVISENERVLPIEK